MAYVPVPKDLNAVKTKVLLNLTNGSSYASAQGRRWAFRCSSCSKPIPASARRRFA